MIATPSTLERPVATLPSPRPAAVRQMLFLSDLTPRSDSAFAHAGLLARTFGAWLTLYHASRADESGAPVERERARRGVRQAREHLDGQAAMLSIPYSILVEGAPSPSQAVLAHVRRARPDLTVMATHGRDGLSHLLAGSVAEVLVCHGGSPVLCVREPEHGTAQAYRRIIVPTDLTATSRRAFPIAALVARAFDAEVVALHAVQMRAQRDLMGVPEALEAAPDESTLATFLQPEFLGALVRGQVVLGRTADVIADVARQEHADLIVLSTHGHDSLADKVLGSHAESVMRHAACPVLVV
jgi:nucleotide-binding universal stress UspA family protein